MYSLYKIQRVVTDVFMVKLTAYTNYYYYSLQFYCIMCVCVQSLVVKST